MSPRVDDFDLLQHLADDHFDVLVVDLHALQSIDFLNLVDEIGGERLDTLDAQDVVRHRVAVDERIALLDVVAFLHRDVLALRDQVFDRLAPFSRLDRRCGAWSCSPCRIPPALDLRDDRVILGLARFEQLGDARQTAGDVAGLGAFARDTREHVAGLHLRARIDRQMAVDRQE